MHYPKMLAMPSLLLAASATLGAQQVKVYPEGPIYLYPANPDRGYVDLVVQAIVFVNGASEPVRLTRLRVEAIDHDATRATATVALRDILRATQDQIEMRHAGMAALADMSVPAAMLGEANTFTATLSVPSHGAVLAPAVYLAVGGVPTTLRVRASLVASGGRTRDVVDTVPVAMLRDSNDYTMPLKGAWFERSIPNITSHHQWHAQTEFAVDFWKLDSLGSPSRGDGEEPTDYYAYGQPVLAAADGMVVAIEDGATQNYAVRRRRSEESDDAYRQRITAFNTSLMISDPHRGIIGNYVVIKHANGEFSAYGHLKSGSVVVRPGMAVHRGEQIGQVGDTGDSPLVHLHFQISDGPDPLVARSIPFRFTDIVPDNADLGTNVVPSPTP